ncbi:hypothetical protein JANAI62_35650 [Jannaschia pagri]|uniref:DUF2948 domain-containing protein n=1 Tax=Jannaschia pagri TaxID=2829797 RepID=A0ABQ4NS61_9RHOB|nr:MULTISPECIES: DUF2948 family protein [unclassified Jannaschia]GIT93151.1 hypothetical protein JANAI61_36090 [Jannaschia sp. AI_61]GIT96942.1 hypothetical protein JANAI62_35650 [Jannaschia sp. AI_62]
MADARFRDGDDRPLRLWATDGEDLQVVSALCQDAVLPASEMRWRKQARSLDLLINRFRWENGARSAERVQCLLTIGDVTAVRGQGVVPGDADTVLSLLSLTWVPAEGDGATDGLLELTFAGDGAVQARCDCLDVTLRDVTRPYGAVSGKVPDHPE